MKLAILLGSIVAVLSMTACNASPAASEASARLRIVSTVSPITNIVYNIAGDKAEVVGIVPEGVNSHTFEPAPSDARRLGQADIIFVNGLKLEEPTLRLAEANVKDERHHRAAGRSDVSLQTNMSMISPFRRTPAAPIHILWPNPFHAQRLRRNYSRDPGRARSGQCRLLCRKLR